MATKKTTTPAPARHPTDPANNDQRLVALANRAISNDQWASEYQERGEALKNLSARVFPGRYADAHPNAWERIQGKHEDEQEDSIIETAKIRADGPAGIAVKLRLLEPCVEDWHIGGNLTALFYSALADAERLAKKGGAS